MMLFLYNVMAGNVRFTEKSLILHPYLYAAPCALYFIGTAASTGSLAAFGFALRIFHIYLFLRCSQKYIVKHY